MRCWLRLTLGLLASGLAHLALANSLDMCDRQAKLSAAQQDRMFRFAALVRDELQANAGAAALVARSGTDLDRLGIRYSHAGVVLRDSDNGAWSVRQLYFACDERQPKVFDQGLAGFMLGTDKADLAYVSAIILPPPQADALARVVANKAQAVGMLAPHYSANAYAYSTRYQNCNQWVVELLAQAWGELDDGLAGAALRQQAQRWLKSQGYVPTTIDVRLRPLMWAAPLIPYLHSDDHPSQDLAANHFRVSMPQAIADFVHDYAMGAQRVEFCHTDRIAVIHRGWSVLPDGCQPLPGDTVIGLQD